MATTVITKSSITYGGNYFYVASLGAGTTTATAFTGNYLDIHGIVLDSSASGIIINFLTPDSRIFKTVTGTIGTTTFFDYSSGGAIRCPGGTSIQIITTGGAGTNGVRIFGINYINS